MAVQIFKDGREEYVEPDSLQAHLDCGWSLEPFLAPLSQSPAPVSDPVADLSFILEDSSADAPTPSEQDAADLEEVFVAEVMPSSAEEGEQQESDQSIVKTPGKRGRPRKNA